MSVFCGADTTLGPSIFIDMALAWRRLQSTGNTRSVDRYLPHDI